MRSLCSCGREEVELGCDLCRYCRADYEERQYHREREAEFNTQQEAEYEASCREKPNIGVGVFPRHVHEPVLLARRGRLPFTAPRDVRSVQRWSQRHAGNGTPPLSPLIRCYAHE